MFTCIIKLFALSLPQSRCLPNFQIGGSEGRTWMTRPPAFVRSLCAERGGNFFCNRLELAKCADGHGETVICLATSCIVCLQCKGIIHYTRSISRALNTVYIGPKEDRGPFGLKGPRQRSRRRKREMRKRGDRLEYCARTRLGRRTDGRGKKEEEEMRRRESLKATSSLRPPLASSSIRRVSWLAVALASHGAVGGRRGNSK